MKSKFSAFGERIDNSLYHVDRLLIRIVYCSRFSFDEDVKKVVAEPVYLDYNYLKYFEKIAAAIKLSALREFCCFCGIPNQELARNGIFPKSDPSDGFAGMLLPESSSGYPAGFKVVSFYADPATLLDCAYVLRKAGWRGSKSAYQRMLSAQKIEDIRKKLRSDSQVFVNNVVATLPTNVVFETEDGDKMEEVELVKTRPVKIRLPMTANSIGLIDGQHRLYSYYQSKNDDTHIAKLRHQQNLLVTGLVCPKDLPSADIERFSAQLFLSINSNQTNAKTALKQEIEVLLKPFGVVSIARQVMERISASGPLAGHVEQNFYDKGLLKTSSIVSFGLSPLVKLSGDDTIFRIFHHKDKYLIEAHKSESALDDYIKFASSQINIFLGAVKSNVGGEIWTSSSSQHGRILTVTCVNGFLIALRTLIQHNKKVDFASLKSSLDGLNVKHLRTYKSSQYNQMAQYICQKHFGI